MSYVMIVDDEAPVRRLMHRWLEAEGRTIVEAASAEQGLLLACQYPLAVVFCDIHMPRGQNGFWLVDELRWHRPGTAIVMTTGLSAFDAAVTGLRAGVADYVVKPLSRDGISAALRRAAAEHETRKAAAAVSGGFRTRPGRFEALLAILRTENEQAARRAERVAGLANALARTLRVTEPELSDLVHAALLRQIERIDVHEVARRIPFLVSASAVAVAVQEHYDGSGFPLGLTGEAIPRGARIVAVAAAFEALMAGSAGAPLTPADALARLCRDCAGRFDPEVLAALQSVQMDLRAPEEARSA